MVGQTPTNTTPTIIDPIGTVATINTDHGTDRATTADLDAAAATIEQARTCGWPAARWLAWGLTETGGCALAG
jgi:hypothetical protein